MYYIIIHEINQQHSCDKEVKTFPLVPVRDIQIGVAPFFYIPGYPDGDGNNSDEHDRNKINNRLSHSIFSGTFVNKEQKKRGQRIENIRNNLRNFEQRDRIGLENHKF